MKEVNISNFFREDYCQYGNYDLYRKIASYVDGLKMSSRKVIYTLLKNNIKAPKKVINIQSRIIEDTNYLHGDMSLYGVIVGLAQDHAGTNNISLLAKDGTFGDRLIPAAAAGRYISTAMKPVMEKIFRKEDLHILIPQEFEGEYIEPQFYVPTLPLLLINGSEGVSTGFSQKILPRDPKEIIRYIKAKLQGKNANIKLIPYYNGFNGTIIKNEANENSYIIKGKFERINANNIRITELPVGYTLASYTKHLDKLEDAKIINTYTDKSNDGKFLFEVRAPRELLKKSDTRIETLFKLNKIETEILTCNDEDNTIIEFNNPKNILNSFITIKLKFMQKRKDYAINKLTNDLQIMLSRLAFVKAVINKKIILNNRSAALIEKDLDKNNEIIKVEDSYDYLLRMPLSSITKERYKQLQEQIKKAKIDLQILKKTTIEDMWLNDIEELNKVL
jgi:DNA topoisomerase-2